MMLSIAEKFFTLSGEAPVPGLPVYLVRFSGCNLSCIYCDTRLPETPAYTMTVDELSADISARVKAFPGSAALITGGEPLLDARQGAILEITERLPDIVFYIETNGSIAINRFPENTHIVCDWKTPSSGYDNCFKQENLSALVPGRDCIKFVLDASDFSWVKERIQLIKSQYPHLDVYLSPQQGALSLKYLASFILDEKLPASISIQLHKLIWENESEGKM